MEIEFFAKIVLLGDGKTGKSSIRRRYMGKGFVSQHLVTIGADFAKKRVKIIMDEKEIPITLQIWDLAGQESFKKIRQRFLNNAAGMIVVFDMTNKVSFKNIGKWIEEAWRINEDISIPILIVSNKCDLDEQRQVEFGIAERYVESLGSKYPQISSIDVIETSALTGKNINLGFEVLSKAICKRRN